MVYRSCLMIFGSLLLVVTMLIMGCGDVDPIAEPLEPETPEIGAILMDRWKQGYETEDLELYMSSFWQDGYYYWSDLATDDVGDDVSFDSWDEERESAISVFKKWRNIEIEITDPPEVQILDEARTKAEVKNHYKIQLYVPEGTSLAGGYEAVYAEGDNIFTFEYRANEGGVQEWRITEWRQNEYSKEEIEAAWEIQ